MDYPCDKRANIEDLILDDWLTDNGDEDVEIYT